MVNFIVIKIICVFCYFQFGDFLALKKTVKEFDILVFRNNYVFERKLAKLHILGKQVVDNFDNWLKCINNFWVIKLRLLSNNALLQSSAVMIEHDIDGELAVLSKVGKFYLVQVDEIGMCEFLSLDKLPQWLLLDDKSFSDEFLLPILENEAVGCIF